ncbi:MAG: dihydroorotate dehydrogenase 2 [Alphaproteobacteria bacterium]|nr:dihydroorotate dehydrogenase 2 [Alphaproteobacteria bacterium]
MDNSSALMRFLHVLPPEFAHKLTLTALRCGIGPAQNADADLSLSLFGKKARNPLGLSGGADKAAEALEGWARMGFGLVEAGTVTLKPRTGNAAPRCWRFSEQSSIVNWLGMPSGGVGPFIANLRAFQDKPERNQLILGASLASPDGKPEELTRLAEECSPLVDYLTLNISNPNVVYRSDANSSPETITADQIKACKSGAGSKPVLLKLGPTKDPAILRKRVETALAAGAAGFVATNTLSCADRGLVEGLSIEWPQQDGKPVGGYSGPHLLSLSCWMVQEIRVLVGENVPIIGVGGVQSGGDALRLLEAGANAIQVYTGLIYKGPVLIREILSALKTYNNLQRPCLTAKAHGLHKTM